MLLLKALMIGMIGLMPPPDAQQQDENDCHVATATVVLQAEPGEDTPRVVYTAIADGEAAEGAHPLVMCSGDDKNVAFALSRYASLGQDVKAGGPWLGVQFGPVPKPLAVHLGIESGQMVLNVMEGSPADVAGLQQYDVITSMGGQPVPADMHAFVDQIRELTPGQTQVFNVVSKGRDLPVSIVIGQRPEMQVMPKYKFDVFEELAQDNQFLRGGILHRDEGGDWRFDHLGALGDGKHFQFLKKLPNGEDFDLDNVFNWVGDLPGQQKTECRVEIKDGKTEVLSLTQNEDGITVTRSTTDENGTKTEDTTTYASEEELQQADPDAYEVLNSKSDVNFGAGAFGPNAPLFWHDSAGNEDGKPFQIYIQKMLDDASLATEEAEKTHQQAMTLLRDRIGADGGPALDMFFMGGKARISFESKPNGEITVTTRKGEEELVERFSSYDDLKARRPELAQKFGRLQDAAPAAGLK